MDHEYRYPKTFADLAHGSQGFADDPQLYVCPATTHGARSMSNVDDWCSYVLILLPSNALPDRVHAFCPPEHHDNKVAIVLFADGAVDWPETAEFEALLTEQQLSGYWRSTNKALDGTPQ